MKFKVPRLEDEYNKAPLLLRLITEDMDGYVQQHFNKEVVITRVLEPVSGESGVHQDYRALDVRNEYCGSRMFNDYEVEIILKYLNEKYYRNDNHNTAIHHSFDGNPLHFHLQIALNTKVYMEDK